MSTERTAISTARDDAPAAATDGSASPSLFPGAPGSPGRAYEIKFLLSEEQAREAEARLLRALLPDPHCDPVLGGMYAITSLACDGPGFGVFFRDEKMKNRKYRVRRYGGSGVVYLERKRSRQGRVRKRRVEAPLAALSAMATGRADDVAHTWFVRELGTHELTPVCRVRYLRRALFGACAEGPMRVTFDRNIRGALAPGWSLDFDAQERPLLDGVVVCEFKFHNAMPSPLKALVAAMRLEATGISKYRTCVRAFAPELGVDLSRAPACVAAGVPLA
jgi:hypothetical protein